MPFGEIQRQVLLTVPPELRVVVYRRLMFSHCGASRPQWRARALVTGSGRTVAADAR